MCSSDLIAEALALLDRALAGASEPDRSEEHRGEPGLGERGASLESGLSALAASRDALRVERDEAQVERDVARDLLERVRRSRWGKIGRMLGLMPKE